MKRYFSECSYASHKRLGLRCKWLISQGSVVGIHIAPAGTAPDDLPVW